uniref:Uncharacterized protein n=1 Tax=Cajanus cajan TaxID=3821 RepID=A0A151QNW6_CAJCA|nr:hypothetical protein KK1_047438 [Cajanus cajan]
MTPFILEILGRSDVVEALARFSRRKNTGLCVLYDSETVTNVTLRQPSVTPAPPSLSTAALMSSPSPHAPPPRLAGNRALSLRRLTRRPAGPDHEARKIPKKKT